MTLQNTSIGIVGIAPNGKKSSFRTLDDEAVEPYLAEMRRRQGANGGDDADNSGGANTGAMAVETGIQAQDSTAGSENTGANAPAASDGDGDIHMQ